MEILEEQKIKYLTRRKAELNQLHSAAGEDLFLMAIDIGHRLKGNGKTFGFPEISEIGLHLESAGLAKDQNGILDEISNLQTEINKQLSSILTK